MAQPSVQCQPAACGGSVLAGTQTPTSMHARWRARNSGGLTRRPVTEAQAMDADSSHSQPRPAPVLEPPQPHRIHRRLRQGPSSRYHLEITTAPVGSMRPQAQPSVQCQPVACGGSVLAGTQMPTSAHGRWRAGNGKEQGSNPHAWYRSTSNGADPSHSQPCPAPVREPPAASRSMLPQAGALFFLPPRNCHSASMSSSLLDCRRVAPGGLSPDRPSMVRYSRRPLPTEWGLCCAMRSATPARGSRSCGWPAGLCPAWGSQSCVLAGRPAPGAHTLTDISV